MKFVFGIIVVACIAIPVSEAQSCPTRKWMVEEGRRCRKPCKIDEDCSAANKKCRCDGACGMTCFNPSATCAELPLIANGRITTTDMTMGSKATYSCDAGYVIKGQVRRTCCADKNWYPSAPNCTRGCGYPENIGNGFPDSGESQFAIGEKVRYMCRAGYYMTTTSDEYRTCQSSGWTAVRYSCLIQTCDALSDDHNGEISYTSGQNFGSIARLTCNIGYRPGNSRTTVRCYAGNTNSVYGEWSGTLTRCEIKTCPPPTQPQDGIIVDHWSILSRNYGTLITYKCNIGFKLEGSATGRCDDDETWGITPNCTLDPDCDFENSRQPTCGYTTPHNSFERAAVDGPNRWTEYVAQSRYNEAKLISAVIPPTWSRSRYVCLMFKYRLLYEDSSLKITSTDDYSGTDIFWQSHRNERKNEWLDSLINIQDDNFIQYQFEAVQSGVQLDDIQVLQEKSDDHCEPNPCRNGGTCVRRARGFTCFCTIDFVGNTCEEDIKCSEPAQTCTNGVLTWRRPFKQDKLIPDSSVKYTCNVNFKVKAQSVLKTSIIAKCKRGGHRPSSYWEPRLYDIECEEILCKEPSHKNNQELVNVQRSFWRVGQQVTAECIHGFGFISRVATDTVTCTNKEVWDNEFTRCQNTKCAAPPTIQNGRRKTAGKNNWFSGDIVTYKCNKHYKFDMSGIVRLKDAKCVRRWTWKRSNWVPAISEWNCIRIKCPKPQLGFKQYIEGGLREWFVGDPIVFRCETGYEFRGGHVEETSTCRDDETWSHAPSSCIENIKCEVLQLTTSDGEFIHVSSGPFLPNSTAKLRCVERYKISGEVDTVTEKTLHCTKRNTELGSEWLPSPSSLKCIAFFCPEPMVNSHQVLRNKRHTKWFVDDTAQYGCELFYEFEVDDPVTAATCMPDETWFNNVTECREDIKCEVLQLTTSKGEFIHVSSGPFLPNSTAKLRCVERYKISGEVDTLTEKTLQCTKRHTELGSEWLPSPSSLKCIAFFCPEPTVNSHQVLRNIRYTKWFVDDTAQYGCEPFYEFEVDDPVTTATCMPDETWFNNVTECREDIKCEALSQTVLNGKFIDVLSEPFLPNSTAILRCNEGHKINGEAETVTETVIRCTSRHPQPGSEWLPTPSSLKCIPFFCHEPTRKDHQILMNSGQTKWVVGDTAQFGCEDFYEFESDEPVTAATCMSDETWSNDVTGCQEDVKCEKPSASNVNGRWEILGDQIFNLNSTATFTCYREFKIKGETGTLQQKIVRCRRKTIPPGSEWDSPIDNIRCIRITCSRPDLDETIDIAGSVWQVNETLRYNCVPGYKLMAPATPVICNANGIWDGAVERCIEDVECEVLSTIIANGKFISVLSEPLLPDSTAKLLCDEGYKIHGETDMVIEKTLRCTKRLHRLGSEWLPAPSSLKCTPSILPKLDLSFLVPWMHENHKKEYAKWIKDIGRNLIGSRDIHVSVLQYESSFPVFIPRNESHWESWIDGLPLIPSSHGTSLWYRTIESLHNSLRPRIREDASNVIIILVDKYAYKPERIAIEVNCMKFPTADIVFVGVHSIHWQNRLSDELEIIAEAIGSNQKNWHYVKRQDLNLVARELSAVIQNFSVPRDQKNRCLPQQPDAPDALSTSYTYRYSAGSYCAWQQSSEVHRVGDKVFLDCFCCSMTSWYKREVFDWNAKCKWDGTWLRNQCNVHSRGRRSVLNDDYPATSHCKRPELKSNMYILDDPGIFHQGLKVTLACFDGFTLLGRKDIMKCKKSGAWTQIEAECLSNTCGIDAFLWPDHTLLDGRPLGLYETRNVGDTVNISCDDGLVLQSFDETHPSLLLTCMLGGRWSDTPTDFTCEEPVINICACPLLPENSYVTNDLDRFPAGTTLNLLCKRGYQSSGSDTITCQENGEWDIPTLRCTELAINICACPLLPENSYITDDLDRFPAGTTLDLHCKIGYQPSGSNTITCRENGEWDVTTLHCTELVINICACPLLPENSYITDDLDRFPAGTTLELHCKRGYQPSGSDTITCKENGEWDIPTLRCTGGQSRCSAPNLPLNSELELLPKDRYEVGEQQKFVCNEHFQFVGGNGIIECEADGSWSEPDGECLLAKECSAPVLPDQSFIENDPETYPSGTTINLDCLGDKTLIGCSQMTCVMGKWSDCAGRCEATVCLLNPFLMADGLGVVGYSSVELDANKFTTAEVVTLKCDENRILYLNGQGDSISPEITCQLGGTWTPRALDFSCGFTCRSPFEPQDGHWVTNPLKELYAVGDHVLFACDRGFDYGSDTRSYECQDDGTWLIPHTPCIDEHPGAICACPLLPQHAVVIDDPGKYPVGTEITVTCEPGFKIVGNAALRCEGRGEWTVIQAKCQEVNECESTPCQNGGECSDGINDYTCSCRTGFTGKDCGSDADDCVSLPCHNGGSCSDGFNAYTCSCLTGFMGKNCETDINECAPNPCRNGGRCFDRVNAYICSCVEGFMGRRCEINIDDCSPNPCRNGAQCIDGINFFSCQCANGYTGRTCQSDINDCNPNPCLNDGSCVDGVNGYDCLCSLGYTGPRCATDVDDCTPNPCLNGAQCTDQVNSYLCSCEDGYTGVRCEINVDDCSPNPCLNDAQCTDRIDGYLCSCEDGYIGDRCEINVDDCSPNPCLNDARCTDKINGYLCSCEDGYTGDRCEINVDDCSPNPCLNDARCADRINGYSCSCEDGYSGDRCEINMDDCSPNPCLNNARCNDQVNGYSCSCEDGYTGTNCETNVDDCSPNPCLNDSQCTDLINGYLCSCEDGYTGLRCETNVNECQPNPCRHVERCEDLLNDFHCVCIPGYTGKRCEKEIDECASSPCHNGGVCTDKLNGFGCTCEPGFTGVTCAVDIDECQSRPCQNDGSCSNSDGKFLCECTPGYTGSLCEQGVTCDHPLSDPNGSWNGDNANKKSFSVNERLTVKCDSGFEYNGDTPFIKCLFVGRWSHLDGECARIVTCSIPDLREGVTFAPVLSHYAAGVEISLRCSNNAASLAGISNAKCLVNGIWTNIDSSCDEKYCIIDHTSLSSGVKIAGFSTEELQDRKFSISDSVNISCSQSQRPYIGSEAFKQPVITCMKGKVWSSDPGDFECRNVCPTPKSLDNGAWVNIIQDWYEINENLWYTCNEGFVHSGITAQSRCEDGGQWSGDFSTLCTETDYPVLPIDIMIVLDGSKSIGADNFETVKHWVKDLTRKFDIERFTKVGVVQYSYYRKNVPLDEQAFIVTEIPLDHHADRSVFESRVDDITLQSFNTYTAHAINKTMLDFKLSDRFEDPLTKKALVLLTDGRASDYHDIPASANYARSLGIVLFAVGVGQRSVHEELQIIANGEVNNNERVYHVNGFSDLDSIEDSLSDSISGASGLTENTNCTISMSDFNDGIEVSGFSRQSLESLSFPLHASISLQCPSGQQPYVQRQEYAFPILTCQRGQKWSARLDMFECKTVCGPADEIGNGNWNDRYFRQFYEVNEALWFHCDPGYAPAAASVRCLPQGEWSGSDQLCESTKK